MFKMMVSDFYKTLINNEEAISLSTMLEIDRIRKSGILFCITTSKSAKIVKDYNKDFPFVDYIVAFNGSYIYDLNNDKVVYERCIGSSIVKKLYKLFNDKDLSFYTLDFCNYTGSYKDKDYSELLIDVNAFLEENKKGIYKVNIYLETLKEAKKVAKTIKDSTLKVEVHLVEEDKFVVVEVTSGISSKLKGVEKLCKLNKFTLSDVIAVCSSSSSASLVQNVGCGCVVFNGDKEVRRVANELTDSNENNGVELIIKKYF